MNRQSLENKIDIIKGEHVNSKLSDENLVNEFGSITSRKKKKLLQLKIFVTKRIYDWNNMKYMRNLSCRLDESVES